MTTGYRCTIPEVLDERGQSVTWFCRKAGISRALYYRWLDGSRPILAEQRRRAADVLGLPESVLFVPIESLASDRIAQPSERVA
jgi:transcriptional regulator with XRE-family HTH domain